MQKLEAVLGRGLKWMKGRQPKEAILSHHGISTTTNGLEISIAQGDGGAAILIFSPYPRVYEKGYVVEIPEKRIGEIRELVSKLAEFTGSWLHTNGGISFRLKTPFSRTLWDAFTAYHQGCPKHPKKRVFCECGWLDEGHKKLRLPKGWR